MYIKLFCNFAQTKSGFFVEEVKPLTLTLAEKRL